MIFQMAKSRAEIQKQYRERKKAKEGEIYLRREAVRVGKYYRPSSSLTRRAREERNEQARIRNRRHREKIRLQMEMSESGYDSPPFASPHSPARLIVKLPSSSGGKRFGPLKRKRRQHSRLNRKIKELTTQRDNLRKRLNTKAKQLQRLRLKKQSSNSGHPSGTPKSKTEDFVKSLKLTPKRRNKVRRKLLLGEALNLEMLDAKNRCSSKRRAILHNIVAGKVAKKYRLLSAMGKASGLSRHCLARTLSKQIHVRRETRCRVVRQLQETVTSFLTREDNSRIQPGKNDAKKISESGSKCQTVVLTDYLSNLHVKFLAEHPDWKLSFTSFTRMRPRNVLPARFISRNACQCLKHQNMALKFKALRQYGIKVSENPETAVKDLDVADTLKSLPDAVVFKTWKKVPTDKGVQRMTVVEITSSKADFEKLLRDEMENFRDHVKRVKLQFHNNRLLKEGIPEHEFILQMDFSENYSCRSVDEVQSAYWNQVSVTLHPVVAYFKDGNLQLKHKNFVIVSDEMSHGPRTVITFIDQMMKELKEMDPNVQRIHYWTDSPSSQYRNKDIFHLVATHRDRYGVPAVWNYFESGHGKGPCDGLGGTTKRMADEAVRRGATTIQDAKGFYDWATSSSSSMRDVTFRYISSHDCQANVNETFTLKAVQGTMKVHAAATSKTPGCVDVKETSCYCNACLRGTFCGNWTTKEVKRRSQVEPNVTVTEESPEELPAAIRANSFVAAVYDQKWYIGKVCDVDDDDGEVLLTFMKISTGKGNRVLFQWPAHPDELWVHPRDILCETDPPQPVGKSKRMFRLADSQTTLIEDKFKNLEMH